MFWQLFFNWANEFPFFALIVICVLIGGGVRLVGLLIRSINILIRGWPPNYLDADGDFVE